MPIIYITEFHLLSCIIYLINLVKIQLWFRTAAAAKSLQSCLTRCDPIDRRPPGSPIPGILQARTLEWVAISFSNAWKWKVKGKSLSRVQVLATPWTTAYRAFPSMGFSRQEYWGRVPLPSPWFRAEFLKSNLMLGLLGELKKTPGLYHRVIKSGARVLVHIVFWMLFC